MNDTAADYSVNLKKYGVSADNAEAKQTPQEK